MRLKWSDALGKAVAVSAVTLMATTNLYAIPRSPCDQKPKVECPCEDPPPGPFAFAFPYDPNMNCPSDLYFYADFLAMQAKQDGMEFAIADTSGLGNALTNGTVGGFSSDHSDWEYNFGARFGIGFYTDHDAWNIDAAWTWLNIRDYRHFNSTTAGGTLIPLWLTGTGMITTSYSNQSSAVWNANYNVLDVRLGKPYYVSRYVVFNPHIGLRGGWIDQHFSVDYSGTTPSTDRLVHHGDNDFWGVGLRTGVNTDWVLAQGFSIFGNAAASLLYGKFKIEQHLQTPSTATQSFDLEDHHYMNVPNAELALGLSWGSHFSQNKYYFSLKAAYEFHVWFDQLNMRRFWAGSNSFSNDVVSRGNLTLNGFSLRASLDI